ncbi:M15 family metallopeptidase [Thomasclavelia sp.]|uniref:M15 family metallopeptidase n=1 Tax=Thomasclavelia sp. TaxID=3025757 RepID=UPI0025F499EE|nr:M15 family metallopeptidase [Thomasclavelia sp.]
MKRFGLLIVVFCLLINLWLLIQMQGEVSEDRIDEKKISEKENNKVIDDELLTLVNYENEVPENWQVNLIAINNNQLVDKRVYDDLMAMLQDGKRAGLELLICSSYRSNEKQMQLYQEKVNEYLNQGYLKDEAENKAAFWVARPGTSEHQLGLAIDIVSKDNQRLDPSQESTVEQQWLMANSYKYGFILRYPTDKSDITKIGYEPWHYRYVGKNHARKIKELDVCLEEYLSLINKS